jgi:hypothetical protein
MLTANRLKTIKIWIFAFVAADMEIKIIWLRPGQKTRLRHDTIIMNRRIRY